MTRVVLWCVLLSACGGTQLTPRTVPEPPPPGRPECPTSAPLGTPTTRPEQSALAIEASLCGETLRVRVPYDGTRIGTHWFVRAARLREALGSATQRELPPVADWSAEQTDFGSLMLLSGDWFYVGRGEPSTSAMWMSVPSSEAQGLIDRIEATFGPPPAPIFVVNAWEEEDKPAAVVVADSDAETFGRRLLRGYLGEGDPWLDGMATFLWQVVLLKEDNLSVEQYLHDWLELYMRHRRTLNGEPHRQSALAGEVMGICQLPRYLNMSSLERRNISDPAWLSQRGVLDVRDCLASFGLQLAAIRYEDATPEQLLRIRSAPGDPPRVARGGSFFRPGDVIVEVNRRRVHTRGDVAWALRDVETGERFVIVVQRGGREARTWARRPRVGERNAVRFALIPIEADES